MLVILLLIVLLNNSYAAECNGPYGTAQIIGFHATDNKLIFAASEYEVYRSQNGGQIWESVDLHYIDWILSNQADPERLLAVSRSYGDRRFSIQESRDRGKTWTFVSFYKTPGNGPVNYALGDLEWDKSNPQILYAAALTSGFLKSTDGGRTWTQKNSGLPQAVTFYLAQIEMDRENPNILFLSLDNGDVYKSTNAGESWLNKSKGLTTSRIVAMKMDPNHSSIIYVGGADGKSNVFKTVDAGEKWFPLDCECFPFEFVVDPAHSQIVYMNSYRSDPARRSTNGGKSWQIYGPRSFAIVPHPRLENVLFSQRPDALYRSNDHGKTWIRHNRGIEVTVDQVVATSDPNIVYAVSSLVLYRSTNGGKSWKPLHQLFPWYRRIGKLFVHPTNQDFLITTGDTSAVTPEISEDGGRNWKRTHPQMYPSFYFFDKNDPNTILAIGDSISISTNLGKTWSTVNLFPPRFQAVVPDPYLSSTLYGSSNVPWDKHFYKSFNGGQSWIKSDRGMTKKGRTFGIMSIAVDQMNSSVLYAGGFGGIFKSMDAGKSWVLKNVGSVSDLFEFIVAHPSKTGVVFASTTNKLFKSIDYGESWNEVDLASKGIESFSYFALTTTERIYLTNSEGVCSIRIPLE